MKTATPNPPSGITVLLSALGVGVLEVGSGAFYLPCPFKSVTGIDCPGCGFQRSVVALWEGDLATSFQTYPPAIPILALFAFLGLKWLFKWDRRDRLARGVGIAVGAMVLLSYGVKMWGTFISSAGTG